MGWITEVDDAAQTAGAIGFRPNRESETFSGHSKEELARRVGLAERTVEGLARAVALVAYWSSSNDDRVAPAVIARLVNTLQRSSGTSTWLDLDRYPAVLALYAAGLGCVL